MGVVIRSAACPVASVFRSKIYHRHCRSTQPEHGLNILPGTASDLLASCYTGESNRSPVPRILAWLSIAGVAAKLGVLIGQIDIMINVLHVIALVEHVDEFFEHRPVFRTQRLTRLRNKSNFLDL